MMNPREIYERLTHEGDEWAETHQAAEMLEGALKSMFSQCVLKYRDQGAPVSECEHKAYADPDYKQARQAAIEARTAANKAKVRYKAAEAWFEAQRSAEATHRAAARAAP